MRGHAVVERDDKVLAHYPNAYCLVLFIIH